jgi:hypothetical protein
MVRLILFVQPESFEGLADEKQVGLPALVSA